MLAGSFDSIVERQVLNRAWDALHEIAPQLASKPEALCAYARMGLAIYCYRADGDDVLAHAIDAFNQAIALMDPNADPIAWGLAQLDLGRAWRGAAIYPGWAEPPQEAAGKAFAAALEALTPQGRADDRAYALLGYAHSRWLVSDARAAEHRAELLQRLREAREMLGHHEHDLRIALSTCVREILTATGSLYQMLNAFAEEMAELERFDAGNRLPARAELLNTKAWYLIEAASQRRDLRLSEQANETLRQAAALVELACEHMTGRDRDQLISVIHANQARCAALSAQLQH
jgi:hypothetical protein